MKTLKMLTLTAMVLGFGTGLGLGTHAGAQESKVMTVYKTPWCGCCTGWAEAMKKAGYQVKTVNMEDLSSIKKQSSVTEALAGCHTAVYDGYVLEGHVPMQALNKLLAERPDIAGIATPGMPMGSLGMGYSPDAKYTVYAFTTDTSKAPTVFYQAGK